MLQELSNHSNSGELPFSFVNDTLLVSALRKIDRIRTKYCRMHKSPGQVRKKEKGKEKDKNPDGNTVQGISIS